MIRYPEVPVRLSITMVAEVQNGSVVRNRAWAGASEIVNVSDIGGEIGYAYVIAVAVDAG